MDELMQLLVQVIGMITHGYNDAWYAPSSLNLHMADPNHTVGSIARMF